MIQGYFQSESKCYFRDQEYFRHFLLFDGSGGVYTITGNYTPEKAYVILTKSTKSLRGVVENGTSATNITLNVLSSGKRVAKDQSNIRSFQLHVEKIDQGIKVRNLDGKDYGEYSGIYESVQVPST